MRARLTLALLLLAEAAAVWAVATRPPAAGAVDWGDPVRWLQATDPETATLVVGRGLVLVVAGWLLLSTLAACGGRALAALPHTPRRVRRAATVLTRCAPGAVVHLVEAAVVVGVVSGAAGPAGAAAAPRATVPAAARAVVVPLDPVRDGRAGTAGTPATATATATPTPAPTPVPTPVPSPGAADDAPPAASRAPRAAVAPPVAPPVAAPGPRTATQPADPQPADTPRPLGGTHHRVAPGEHLWGIAEAVVAAHGSDDPEAVERYWRVLCDANRGRLASGDVDVLAVGEDLDLPPVA